MRKEKSKDRAVELAFGRALKEIRTEVKMSQEKLALESGYHPTYISMLERGIQNPSLRTILRFAQILNVKGAAIVERVEEKLGGSVPR